MWFSCYWRSIEDVWRTLQCDTTDCRSSFSCIVTCGRGMFDLKLWDADYKLEHPWAVNVCMHGGGKKKCTTQKSRMQRWLWSLILAARWPQVLHPSPVSLALSQTLALWRFEELLFSRGLLHGASHLHISLTVASALSLLLPLRPFWQCHCSFFFCLFFVCFFLKGCILT